MRTPASMISSVLRGMFRWRSRYLPVQGIGIDMRTAIGLILVAASLSHVCLRDARAVTTETSPVTIYIDQRWTYEDLFTCLREWGLTNFVGSTRLAYDGAERMSCSFIADFRLLPRRTVETWIGRFALSDGVVQTSDAIAVSPIQEGVTNDVADQRVRRSVDVRYGLTITNIIRRQAILFLCQKAGVGCVLSSNAAVALAKETILDYRDVPLRDILSRECQQVGVDWCVQDGCVLFTKAGSVNP